MKKLGNILAAITCFTGIGLIVFYGDTLFASPLILVPLLALFFSGAYFLGMVGYIKTEKV